MASSDPVTVLCVYRVPEENQAAFLELLEGHWPTLSRLGLVTDEPARFWKGSSARGQDGFIEIFTWKNAEAPELAHQTPEVMSTWEPMGELCSDMDFIDLSPARSGASST